MQELLIIPVLQVRKLLLTGDRWMSKITQPESGELGWWTQVHWPHCWSQLYDRPGAAEGGPSASDEQEKMSANRVISFLLHLMWQLFFQPNTARRVFIRTVYTSESITWDRIYIFVHLKTCIRPLITLFLSQINGVRQVRYFMWEWDF